MAALMRSGRAQMRNIIRHYPFCSSKFYSTENDNIFAATGSSTAVKESTVGGPDSDRLLVEGRDSPVYESCEKKFDQLLRNSKFVQIGDLRKTVVVGKIIQVVDNDVYIDFGSKFHCVCKKPKTSLQLDDRKFQRGSKVKILLKDYEMTASFSGTSTDITLLEADATLLGSISSQSSNVQEDDKVETFNKRRVSKERTNWEAAEPDFDIRTFIADSKEI
ncbi:uncharacterized protein LOC132547636 [Ylistrum balloti]|uniref:uncharacterized protein LOC132547636 n=1 Tax=Ylistrum balloti TaxID=509963 RepID=UPI002905EC7D|nr:uncharacterized protein LOC132547636 [Ylistrum balloti]